MSYYHYYSTRDYIPDDTESLLKQTVIRAVAEGSDPKLYSERITKEDDKNNLWIRSFLIKPGVYNSRGWAVSPETVLNNIYSIVGKPLLLSRDPMTGKADHPAWNSKFSAEANMKNQGRDAVGVVKKVFYDKETDSYYADSIVTDAKAKEYISSFHDKKIPIPVSPQLVYDSRTEQPNYYRDWEFSHLAIVDRGAYGAQAAVIGSCDGNEETCHKKLQRANVIAASAAAAASASAPGLELMRNTSSQDAFLGGSMIYRPTNGKRRGTLV